MSVLIKGLEMPTTCTMCWLNTFCGVWNTEPVKHKGFNERLENCPLTELIRCKDCKYFDPPHVEKDGERHEYSEFPKEAFDLFGIGVTVTYGTNVGGRCKYYNLCKYPEDKSVFVPADNYCGRAEPKEAE